MIKNGIALICLLVLNSCASNLPIAFDESHRGQWNGNINDSQGDHLAEVITGIVEENNIPGISLRVEQGNGRNWNLHIGHEDSARTKNIGESSLFQIGSATKTFTALEIFLQIEAGRINLNDTLDQWYPEFPQAEEITLEHLLNHSSGLEDIFMNNRTFTMVLTSMIRPHTNWDQARVIRALSKKDLIFEPGTQFKYSNTNYLLLGAILEKVTGIKAHELFERDIFIPLNMVHSYLPPADPRSNSVLVEGLDYNILPMGPRWMDSTQTSWTTLTYTAGGAISSTEDLLLFYKALINSTLLTETSTRIMLDIKPMEANYPEDSMIGYKYGLAKVQVGNHQAIGHRGGIMGYDTTPLYFPELDLYISLMSNHSKMDSNIGLQICEAILENF